MFLKQDQVKQILKNRPQGTDEVDVLDELVKQGFQLEGVDMAKAKSRIQGIDIVERQGGGIISETGGDVRETFRGIQSDFTERSANVGESRQAQRQGGQGLGRTLFQTVGQSAGLLSDVVGRGIVGVGKALLPQRAEESIAEKTGQVAQSIVQTEPVRNLIARYQQIQETNPALARDIDAALGIGQVVADVATAGVGGRAANLGVKATNRAVDTAQAGAGMAGRGARRVGFELEGALTGTSQETLEQAFQAAFRGGEELDQFTKALRGQVTPENLVDNVRNSLNTVQSANSRQYREALSPIVGEVVDTSQASRRLTSRLKDFNITVTPDGLDFSQSKFRTVPQAQTKIQRAFDEVVQLGDETTLGSVDTTRQALKELILTGDDNSARSANALIEEAVSSVRDSGKQVPGYEKLLSDFTENAEFLDEITRSLASGDRQTIDTAYRRLATSLKTNNERRMNLIKQLDEATGGFILSNVAGQQLSEALPRGLFRQIAAGMAGAGIITGGIGPSLLIPIVFASPRVAGELIKALGLGARGTAKVVRLVDSFRKVFNDLDVKLPLASPLSEAGND